MRGLHEKFPGDPDRDVLRLSLLGTVRPGDKGVRRQMQAAALPTRCSAPIPIILARRTSSFTRSTILNTRRSA
jgi:hypothetical protein